MSERCEGVQLRYAPSLALLLAEITPIARTRARICADPALITIGILTSKPAIQGLLEVIQILGLAVALALSRARVVLRQTLIAIEALASLEPAIVATDGRDGVVVILVQLPAQVIGAGIDVVLDGIRAHAVGVVLARNLHQAGRGPAGVGLAGGFLHGDEGEDHGVNAVAVAADLEVLVVLLAVLAGAGVEGWAVDVVQRGEVEERRVPAVAVEAGIEPILRTGYRMLVIVLLEDIGKSLFTHWVHCWESHPP